MDGKKILVVEPHTQLCTTICEELCRLGYNAIGATDGMIAIEKWNTDIFCLVITNFDLPLVSGINLCRRIRDNNKTVPIIIMGSTGDIHDKVQVFNFGADDYLVKPFHFVELFHKINIFLKRNAAYEQAILSVGDIEIDFNKKTVKRNGKSINLHRREFDLFSLLVKSRNKIVSKDEILSKIFYKNVDSGNSVEVYVSMLRSKIDKPFHTKSIYTKPGFGYYFREPIDEK